VTVRRNRSTENLIGVVEVSAPPISVCKDLHREEVLGRRNAKRSGATNVDLGRSCDEFRLDTARRADQVDVDPGTSDESRAGPSGSCLCAGAFAAGSSSAAHAITDVTSIAAANRAQRWKNAFESTSSPSARDAPIHIGGGGGGGIPSGGGGGGIPSGGGGIPSGGGGSIPSGGGGIPSGGGGIPSGGAIPSGGGGIPSGGGGGIPSVGGGPSGGGPSGGGVPSSGGGGASRSGASKRGTSKSSPSAMPVSLSIPIRASTSKSAAHATNAPAKRTTTAGTNQRRRLRMTEARSAERVPTRMSACERGLDVKRIEMRNARSRIALREAVSKRRVATGPMADINPRSARELTERRNGAPTRATPSRARLATA